LYAISRDADEQPKAQLARDLLTHRDLALSAQVLQEFYVQATRVTHKDALNSRDAADLVTSFTRFHLQSITAELVLLATRARDHFQLSYWDAAIIEAARLLGCDQVLSEDLNHGQNYDGVTVLNPFRSSAS
jgi:predicted nucleic acid-binding protein